MVALGDAGAPDSIEDSGPWWPKTEVLASPAAFKKLFAGHSKAWVVTYVGDPAMINKLFEEYGFEQVDLIISEPFDDVKKKFTGPEMVTRLKARIDAGELRVYTPKRHRRIHSKVYILENAAHVRIVHTSRNLMDTNSIDTVTFWDLPADHPFVGTWRAIYERHLEYAEPFLGDLLDRIRKDPDSEPAIIEAFLANPDDNVDAVPVVLVNTMHEAIDRPDIEQLQIAPMETAYAQKKLVQALKERGVDYTESAGTLTVNPRQFRSVIQRQVGLPIMEEDLTRGTVKVVIGDEPVLSRSSPAPTDPKEVDAALAHVEAYISTIDGENANAEDKQVHKTAMTETLLYIFAAPFSHDLMQLRRRHVGIVDSRGPRFLMVYGQTQRGKTTFVDFVLSLVAGRTVKAIKSSEFKQSFLDQARTFKTVFPLVFDDLPSFGKLEQVCKEYWEKNWKPSDPVPQLVFTTNRTNINQSVRSRLKKVYFPVFIQRTPEKSKALNDLRARETNNHLFEWFARAYGESLSRYNDAPPDDELFLARMVMKRLYTYAGRPVPSYFPEEPFEKTHDTSRAEWSDMLYGLRKAKLRDTGDRILVEFSGDMETDDVAGYLSSLPTRMNAERKGNTVVVNSANEFRTWLPPSPTAEGTPSLGPVRPTLRSRIRTVFNIGQKR